MGGAINWRQSPPKARRQTAARRESILGASLFACLDSRDQAGRWHARCCCPAHSADACEVASVVEASVTALSSCRLSLLRHSAFEQPGGPSCE